MIEKSYRADIDVLRAISVLAVVVFHAFPGAMKGGYLGVDIFFVISGFLITRNVVAEIEDGSFAFSHFYRRRIQRIFPVLLFVLLIALVLGALFLYPDEYEQLGQHAYLSSFFVLNFGLMNEIGYFDVDSHFKPLLHLWSLSVEEQFYLVWPALLLVLWKLKASLKYAVFTLSALSLVAYLYFVRIYPDQVFFNSLTRFWQIGFGGFLGLQNGNGRIMLALKKSPIIFPSSLVIILVSLMMFEKGLGWGLGAVAAVIGAMLFIASERNYLSKRPLVYIGKISYSLYLWHWLFISFALIYASEAFSTRAVIGAVGMSFLMAVISYHTVEKVRYWGAPLTAIALIAAALIIAAFGKTVDSNEGFKHRAHLRLTEAYLKDFERTPSKDQGCTEYIKEFLMEPPQFAYCRSNFNSSERPILAILGDSHAHASFPGISDLAARHGFDTVLLASSSCPPLIGFLQNKNPKLDKSCEVQIPQRLKIISGDNRIAKVLLITRGPVYISGEIDVPFTEETVAADAQEQIGKGDKFAEFATGMRATISALSQLTHVKDIFVLTENPELDFTPKDVLPRPFDKFGISIQESRESSEFYETRMKIHKQIIENAVPDFPKAQMIDVGPYFCEQDLCFTYYNGRFLYADNDHFSVYGSEYLASKIERIIFHP